MTDQVELIGTWLLIFYQKYMSRSTHLQKMNS